MAIGMRAYLPEGEMNSLANVVSRFRFGTANPEGLCIRSGNPDGEWNTLELACLEDESLRIGNGHVIMMLRNSCYLDEGNQ